MRTESNKQEREEHLILVARQLKRDYLNGNLRDFRENLMKLEKQDLPFVILHLSWNMPDKSAMFGQFRLLAEIL